MNRRQQAIGKTLTSAALFGLLLSACSTVAPPDAPLAATAETPAQWRNVPPGNQLAPAPDLHAWWKVFNDTELDRLIDRALAQNLSLAQAQARIRQTRALLGQSGTAFLPTARLFTANAETASLSDSYFQYGLDASWEISLFGRRESQVRIAQGELDTARADEQGTRVALVAEVARTWTELRTARALQHLQQQLTEQNAKRVAWLAQRQTLGLSSIAEVNAARAQQRQDMALTPIRRQAAALAAQRLAVLLGQTAPDPGWLSGGSKAPALRQDFSMPALPADLLRTRPDILRAEAEVLRAAGELGVARADLYPRLTLGAGYVFAANVTQNFKLNGHTDHNPFFGPMLDIPLFDWGRRRAMAQAQSAALDAALLGYRQTVLEAVAEVENALTALDAQQARLTQERAAQAALGKTAAAQRTLTGLGLSSPLAGLDHSRAQTLAAQASIEAQTAHTLAFVALYKALGGAPLPDMSAATAAEGQK